MQKYQDFVEVAQETITDYTKEVDGQSVPKWNSEEINEIVIAQVRVNIVFDNLSNIIDRLSITVGSLLAGRIRHDSHYVDQHHLPSRLES